MTTTPPEPVDPTSPLGQRLERDLSALLHRAEARIAAEAEVARKQQKQPA